MAVYLVQHGEAKSEEEDPQRRLTDRGLRDTRKVAEFLARLDIQVDAIFHSGKKRAMQTALIFSDFLRPRRETSGIEGISPMDDPGIWYEKLNKADESVMIVSHLPYLSSLAGLLLVQDKERQIIDFKMGGVVCLRKLENFQWTLSWMVTPEVVQ